MTNMQKLLDWLDARTGYRHSLDDALYEHIPSGARWRYVFGSTLVFAFVTQVITGLFLWMAYSPSSQTAWESVYYIQYQMQGGWLLRGVHHFMAQAMVVLLALHLLQVIIDGAYRAPREVNFWLGLVLMQLVLGLSLTGYLLPWDQKGYWATSVATNLMTLVPVVGDDLQKLVVGGSEYGHHTLTRFFALHAGILPTLLVMILVVHLALFRKHGLTAVLSRNRADAYFWPDQVLKDAIACLAVLAVVLMLTIHFDFGAVGRGELSPHKHGAELGAPADGSQQYSAARPEWYFLFLFQLLKYFPGPLEIIGALVLPGLVMFLLFLMPITAKLKGGHAFNVAFILLVLGGAGALTLMALRDDYYAQLYTFDAKKFDSQAQKNEFNKYKAPFDASQSYLTAVEDAHHSKKRMIQLIQHREAPDKPEHLIPREGAISLLRGDPYTQGPRLFKQRCLGCHAHTALDAAEAKADPKYPAQRKISAPNLDGFASRQWIAGLLDPTRIRTPDYFGNTAHRCGDMAQWLDTYVPWAEVNFDDLKDDNKINAAVLKLKLKDSPQAPAKLRELALRVREKKTRVVEQFGDGQLAAAPAPDHGDCHWTESQKKKPPEIIFANLRGQLDDVAAALSAQAQLPKQQSGDEAAAKDGRLARGLVILKTTCAKGCHRIGDAGELGLAPDLTGYGSWEWMMGMASDPAHARYYGPTNDRMPAFGKNIAKPEENALSAHQISLIVDWLRGDYIDPDGKLATGPHTRDQADRALEMARLTELPAVAVVGAGEAPADTVAQRAQRLFRQNCASCHSFANEHGIGIVAKNPSAPNLLGFASRAWLDGLLDPEKITIKQYFGNTAHKDGQMAGFVESLDREDEDLPKLIAALSAEAQLPAQKQLDEQLTKDGVDQAARIKLVDGLGCVDCHSFHGQGNEDAPDLTGYGSLAWMREFIADPGGPRFYGRAVTSNDRMPRFAGHPGGAGRRLSDEEIELVAKFIRGEL
jgi:ubiquinol-cytochrome c reductase cytochrome b subunit